jgi:hypothetical protein
MNMPLVEYVLLAILGSMPIAPGTSSSISPRTYGAESVAQPAGSVPVKAGYSNDNRSSNSDKKATTGNSNSKKPPEKGKKGTSGTSTPPPK